VMGGGGRVSGGGLEGAIAALLDQRTPGKTICPSEAARAVGGKEWRNLMPDAREAAARMAGRGEVVVTQRGLVVDARSARGPIRIGRHPTPGSRHPPSAGDPP
jgi:hypothetical protein